MRSVQQNFSIFASFPTFGRATIHGASGGWIRARQPVKYNLLDSYELLFLDASWGYRGVITIGLKFNLHFFAALKLSKDSNDKEGEKFVGFNLDHTLPFGKVLYDDTEGLTAVLALSYSNSSPGVMGGKGFDAVCCAACPVL